VADPVAVLVVTDYYGDLLRPGPCGSRPARAYRAASGAWVDVEPLAGWTACALPLWWDGALVPEGWDRARRVHDRQSNAFQESLNHHLDNVLGLGRALVALGFATRVVLLDRIYGRLVERAP